MTKKFLILSLFILLSTHSFSDITVNTSADSILINNAQTTSDDMNINGNGSGTTPSLPASYLQGYKVENGGHLTNENKLMLNGNYNIGIYMTGNSSVVNNGEIHIEKEDGVGIFSDAQGILNNSATGKIYINNGGTGIKLQNNPNAFNQNNGAIKGINGGIGISLSNSFLHNNGTIEFLNGIGIESFDSDIINTGSISSNKFGVYLTDSTFDNQGTITATENGTGIVAKNSVVENNNKIQIDGNSATGIYMTGNSDVYNNGEIHIEKQDGVGVFSDAQGIFNNSATGKIYINNGGTGIKLQNNPNAFNQNNGLIEGLNGGTGVSLSNSFLHNTGTIKLLNGIGIESFDSDVINTGSISSNKFGVYLTDSTFDNQGTITATENGTGIVAKNSVVENNNKIQIDGNSATGIYVTGNSDVYNKGEIHIEKQDGVGIFSDATQGILSNSATGKIYINNGGTGIKLQNNPNAFNQNNGLIEGLNGGTGIFLSNSFLQNTGTIELLNGIGIESFDSDVINTGSISSNKFSVHLTSSTFNNHGIITATENGTGIVAKNSVVENNNKIQIDGNSATGIYMTGNSDVYNNGEIHIEKQDGVGILSDAVQGTLNNSATGKIYINNGGTGIKLQNNPNAFNQNNGLIEGLNGGTGVSLSNSFLYNNGTIKLLNGIGIESFDSDVVNTGSISSNKFGVYLTDSTFNNYGIITVTENGTGVITKNSIVENSGSINTQKHGIISDNNITTTNAGKINSETGVEITSGSNKFSNHFSNSGEITGTKAAIKFNNSNSVLELKDGSIISGLIEAASTGNNVLIVNGEIIVDTVNNFSKLVASKNTVINGTLNLIPSESSIYYLEAFEEGKNLSNIFLDSPSLGNLTLNGVINIGIDYDNIKNETNKTGKIIAESLNLTNGKIVLQNGGQTINNIIDESGLKGSGDQIRIKSIVISNKQQAVNPDFKFDVSDDLAELEGWKRETIARVENGVTVLDELYTNYNKGPVTPEKKENSVPRSRVDLDNINAVNNISNSVLSMKSDSITVGQTIQEVNYIGTKFNSKFDSSNDYNYDYDYNSDGIAVTTLERYSDNLYRGFTLGFSKNNIKYSNHDKEKIDSFNGNIFGRYQIGNWNIDGYTSYGYNRHTLDIDWLGLGVKKSKYNSHISKTGIILGYNQKMMDGKLIVTPNIGLNYLYLSERKIVTDDISSINSATKDGLIGKVGLTLGNTKGDFRWNIGVDYEHSTKDSFHGERKMSNGYVMEKLYYDKNTIKFNLDTNLKITESFSVKAGYELENNKNFKNHSIKAGFSYTF